MSQSPFNFSFILQGRFSEEEQINLSDSLIEAGCDYPEVSAHNDIITLEFFKEGISENFQGVVLEEIKRVESLGVLISSLVETDAVTVSDIAERSGINKMSISRYSRQTSAAEDFPAPVYGEKWSWLEVAAWLNARGKLSDEDCKMAEALKNAGNAISVRTLMSDTGTTHFWENITGYMLVTQSKQVRSQLKPMRVSFNHTGKYLTATKKPVQSKLRIFSPVIQTKESNQTLTTKNERSKHHGPETG